jgi:D-alanyl-D-alanine carboxypeptidase (penicillin-binding protein 5/6)
VRRPKLVTNATAGEYPHTSRYPVRKGKSRMVEITRIRVTVFCIGALLLGGFVAAAPVQARSNWPSAGQAAYAFGGGALHSSPHEHVAPIASMAKVMTGYLVLRATPLPRHTAGFRMTVTQRDVDDRNRRVARDESTVPVQVGERLTERQALAALLLPSANNIAIMLARKVSGTVARFVRLMNRTARALGLAHTTYTDPSGFDSGTRSTPSDQVMLARVAMRRPTFQRMVAHTSYQIPVAGTIYNTDWLLGSDGFVGIKTGSMDASGGCFMFLSHRRVHGKRVDLYGVVMGQQGSSLIDAGLDAAQRLADRVAPTAA